MLASVKQNLLVVASCGVFLYLFLNLNFDFLAENNAQNAEAAPTTTTTTTATTTTVEESEEELDFLEFMVFREGEEEEEGYAVKINPITQKENEDRNTENKTLETSPILLSPETNPVQQPTPSGHRNAIRLPLTEFPSVSYCDSNSDPSRVNKSNVYPCKHWHHVNERDKVWPVILKPSNGKILEWLSNRRYDDPEVEELVEEQLQVQKQRLAQIRDTCKAHPEVAIKQYMSLVWAKDRSPPLVYCPVYKSASTTWMTYFLRLKHVNDNNPALLRMSNRARELRKYMPRYGGGHHRVFTEYPVPKSSKDKRRVFEDSVRFLVVRHPFARILSAYRDKIERPYPLPFRPYFQQLQKAILARYREPGDNSTDLPPHPTFSEFVDYLIESTKNLKTAKDWMENVICWIPYWVQCGVCSSDYQVIVKVETMVDDEQLLAHVADLTEIQDRVEWRNRRAGSSTSMLLPDYFKTLTRHQVQLLHLRFKMDFDLFGYTIEEYLDVARQV
ncbi:carbohydrate sulfotransferase 11-like [Eriocheir sinensis]|uniref:carbohydrate sulfotransferase 11-like n=1 Tax=Eriocheir sinensis TaxID=95602 RepID=UPI0021CA2CC9|nr:carbohydrate sulfotransferase 11-like [Eriocheir sinensis]